MITPIEIHMKLQDATRAITRKLLKDQPDGFIADFTGEQDLPRRSKECMKLND